MAAQLSNSEKALVRFIYEKPYAMMQFLARQGVVLSKEPTRRELLVKTYDRMGDKNFVNNLNQMLKADDESYSNVIPLVIYAGLTLASLATTAGVAYANQKSNERQTEALLYAKELEDYNRAQNEKAAKFDEIIAKSTQEYTDTLREQSTQRQKNAIYIIGAIGVVLLVVLFTQKSWSRG